MKHIKEILNIPITIDKDFVDERTTLIYEIANYFNEKPSVWFRWCKESRIKTGFLRRYFEDAINTPRTKKTQARFLMAKLFPLGYNKEEKKSQQ